VENEESVFIVMKILYIGTDWGTSLHRCKALTRFGHDVFFVDPFSFIPSNRWVGKWIYETGAWGLESWIKRNVLIVIREMHFDFVLINGGNIIGPSLVKELKRRFGYVVNYNNDDPFSRRELRKWRLYRDSISEYDLLVVLREQNIK